MWSSIAKIVLILVCVSPVLGQQYPMHTQTTNNLPLINPAYAGFADQFNGTILNRTQWTSIDGAPNTQFLNFNGTLGGKEMGWGAQLVNDEIGPAKALQFFGSYSYRIALKSSKLSFGLQAGAQYDQYNWSEISTTEANDPAFAGENYQTLSPQFGFGAYWESKSLSIGLSIPWILENTDLNGFDQRRHYFAHLAYLMKPSKKVFFKPAAMVKYLPDNRPQFDLAANFIYQERVWLTAGIRTQESLFMGARIKVLKPVWVGYSYDARVQSQYPSLQASTHEVFLYFQIPHQQYNERSPRYF